MLPSLDKHFNSEFLNNGRSDVHQIFTAYSWGESPPIGIKILHNLKSILSLYDPQIDDVTSLGLLLSLPWLAVT